MKWFPPFDEENHDRYETPEEMAGDCRSLDGMWAQHRHPMVKNSPTNLTIKKFVRHVEQLRDKDFRGNERVWQRLDNRATLIICEASSERSTSTIKKP